MTSKTEDLKFAQATGSTVVLQLLTGEEVMTTKIVEVDDVNGTVVIDAPVSFEDETTTRSIEIDLIASIQRFEPE